MAVSQWLLTAAHCVTWGRQVLRARVKIGGTDLRGAMTDRWVQIQFGAIMWYEVRMALDGFMTSNCFLWQENLQDQDPPWLRLKDQ